MRWEGICVDHGWEKQGIPENPRKQERIMLHLEMRQVWKVEDIQDRQFKNEEISPEYNTVKQEYRHVIELRFWNKNAYNIMHLIFYELNYSWFTID